MASWILPDGYASLDAEIYYLRPGETIALGAIGGVLSNDRQLPANAVIDHYTAFLRPDEFPPLWEPTGRQFTHGSFSLGQHGEFSYTASVNQPEYQFFEIFFYEVRTSETNFIGWIEFIVQEDSAISDRTPLTGLHKADFSADASVVGQAKVDTLILSDLPPDVQERIVLSRESDVISLNVDGTTLTTDGIERLQFSSGTLAFDIDGHAGQAYRLYAAAFDREPDDAGLKFWITELDRGMALAEAASGVIDSDEFKERYGADPIPTISGFYINILDREPEGFEIDYWLMEFTNQSRSMAEILVEFSESPENVAGVAPLLADGIWLI